MCIDVCVWVCGCMCCVCIYVRWVCVHVCAVPDFTHNWARSPVGVLMLNKQINKQINKLVYFMSWLCSKTQ